MCIRDSYYAAVGLDGFENWYRVQAQEERDHAMLFYQYLQNNGEGVNFEAIAKPEWERGDHMTPLKKALEHEKFVTASIDAIYAAAYEAKDFRAMQMLDWFIKEQGEEEKNAADLITKMELFGGDSKGLYMPVSYTHLSEAFKYSHIVLASVTYNLGIYPAMHDFLMDMKALNLQNRTFALIENGSWAVKSGDLMQKFVNNELKNMTVLNERLSLASSLGEDKAVELETLADAILASVQ